jgi:hypothetical protein
MSPLLQTILMLIASNIFMTFAWYGHLRDMAHKPLMYAVLVSWGIAFFEYLVQVPANRVGYAAGINLAQLKIMQEVITLAVFAPFAIFYMKFRLDWNFLAAAGCMCGAVYFVMRTRPA